MNNSLKQFLKTSVFLYGTFIFMQLTTWLPLRYWRIWGGGNFIDSQQILFWSKCYQSQGNLIFSSHGECSGYMYGSALVRILSFFHLNPSKTQIFGYTFMLILALTISYQVRMHEKYLANPFFFIIVFSPPILLLAERANFDILVFSLVIVAGMFFNKNFHTLALLPLALATLLKFYTLPMFLLFFVLNDSKRRRFATFLVAVSVSVRIFLDLKLIETPFPSGFSSKFGASIWPRYLTQLNISDLGALVDNLSGAAALLFVLATTFLVLKKLKVSISSEAVGNKKSRVIFYLLFGTHLSCYFLGMSFDYRLVFLAVSSLIFLHSFVLKQELLSKIVLVVVILALWLTYPSSGLEPIGDLATEVLTVILGVRFLQLLKSDVKLKNAK